MTHLLELSVVIPFSQNEDLTEDFLKSLSALSSQDEVIFATPKGASLDASKIQKYLKSPFQHVISQKGRAQQMNAGALVATKKFLWFLHADSQFNESAVQKLRDAFSQQPQTLYYFDLKFDEKDLSLLKINEVGAYFRSHYFKMPFGDQGLAISKDLFFQLGLYDETAPYGEDHLLVWKARQNDIQVKPVNCELITSSRKYRQKGWLTTTARHLYLTYKQAFPEWQKLYFLKSQKATRIAVAVFVKTPGWSPLKTRLSQTFGEEKTLQFYRQSIQATSSALIRAQKNRPDLDIYWAVAEEKALDHSLWSQHARLWQGNGGLADRLDTIYKNLLKKYSGVVLIGADSPHVTASQYLNLIEKAQNQKCDYFFGPTDDGGFYFFYGHKPIPSQIWQSTIYSQKDTLRSLELNLRRIGAVVEGPASFDIDTEGDLEKLKKQMSECNSADLTPEQIELFNWLQA